MIKRARRIPTVAGSDVENLVHECTVTADSLRLRTWYRQRDGINQPGDGGAGENILGENLSPRLAGMLLRPTGDITVPWDNATMRDGAVHYISTLYDGTSPPLAYRVMEVDQIAGFCPSELRAEARYPHWQHKQFVHIADWIGHLRTTIGVGMLPAVKIITDGDGSEGFTGPHVIVEARVGPLGFIGDFDPTIPENGIIYRDYRKVLQDGSTNPDHAYFDVLAPIPENWEFG